MATLEKVQSRIAKLQRQAEALLRQKNAVVIEGIRALMVEHGLTTADIEVRGVAAKTGAKRGRKPGMTAATKRATARSKGKLPPKYMNPATGETWSGHARPPAWIKDVKDRSKFLIAGSTGGAADAAKQKTAAGRNQNGAQAKAVASGAAAKRVAAKKKTATAKKAAAKKGAAGKTATKKASAKRASSTKVGANGIAAGKASAAKQSVRRSDSTVAAPATL